MTGWLRAELVPGSAFAEMVPVQAGTWMFDVSGTSCVLGDSSAVLTSISLPGAVFLGRVEWFPCQNVPHSCLFGPSSGF